MPSGSSSPSSTWKEWPQPHDETAFGLSILKPDSVIVFRKSIVRAVQVRRAVRVDDDRDALELKLDVPLGHAGVEAEAVLEAGAAATLNRDAKHERVAVRLLRHQLPDLLGRDGRQRDQRVGWVLDGCHGLMVADGVEDLVREFVTLVSVIPCGISRSLRAARKGEW